MAVETKHRGAASAHLVLVEGTWGASEPASRARRCAALALAVAYFVSAPALVAHDALAAPGVDGNAAVLKGGAGPGAGGGDADDDDNDDGARDPGTSRGGESDGTTGGAQSTNNQDGDNTDGRKDAGTSVNREETVGTTGAQQSTGNEDGDNPNGGSDRGTSLRLNETAGTTGGWASSWTGNTY